MTQATLNTTEFQSKSGLRVWIRPLREEDAPHLVDLFEHMGPDSRYMRFHRPLDNPSESEIWRGAQLLTHIDPATDAAFIAFADLPGEPEAPVAVVRYGYVEPGVVEMAVTVRDELRGTGIGTFLTRLIVEHARQAGLSTILGLVQRSNTAMFRVFQKLPYRISRQSEGPAIMVYVHLDEPTGSPSANNGTLGHMNLDIFGTSDSARSEPEKQPIPQSKIKRKLPG